MSQSVYHDLHFLVALFSWCTWASGNLSFKTTLLFKAWPPAKKFSQIKNTVNHWGEINTNLAHLTPFKFDPSIVLIHSLWLFSLKQVLKKQCCIGSNGLWFKLSLILLLKMLKIAKSKYSENRSQHTDCCNLRFQPTKSHQAWIDPQAGFSIINTLKTSVDVSVEHTLTYNYDHKNRAR